MFALQSHAKAGPFVFSGADCAGSPPASNPAPSNPSLGLAVWPSFQAGPLHNLDLAEPAAGATPLAASWSFQTNGNVAVAPTVVGGIAYAGSMDGCVYALDVSTGRLLWSFAADNQIMSEPVVVGGMVFFGSGNKGLGRVQGGIVRGTGYSGVYALDAATGQQRWYAPTLGGNMTTPAYSNGLVYEVGGGKIFYAIDATSGQVRWQLPIGSYVSMSSPTLSGHIAVFGAAAPYALIGVDVQAERIAWSVALPTTHSGVDDVTPAVANGVAYAQIPEGSTVKRVVELAVQTDDGQTLWQHTLGVARLNLLQRALGRGDLDAHDGEETGIATLSEGVVYVGSPGLHGLWALNAATGAPIWSRPAAIPEGIRTPPAVAGDRLYVTSNTALYVLDATTGAVLERTQVDRFKEGTGIMVPCTTPGPEVVGGTLLLGTGTDADTILAMPLRGLP